MQLQLMFSSFWHEVDGFWGTPRSLNFVEEIKRGLELRHVCLMKKVLSFSGRDSNATRDHDGQGLGIWMASGVI